MFKSLYQLRYLVKDGSNTQNHLIQCIVNKAHLKWYSIHCSSFWMSNVKTKVKTGFKKLQKSLVRDSRKLKSYV